MHLPLSAPTRNTDTCTRNSLILQECEVGSWPCQHAKLSLCLLPPALFSFPSRERERFRLCAKRCKPNKWEFSNGQNKPTPWAHTQESNVCWVVPERLNSGVLFVKKKVKCIEGQAFSGLGSERVCVVSGVWRQTSWRCKNKSLMKQTAIQIFFAAPLISASSAAHFSLENWGWKHGNDEWRQRERTDVCLFPWYYTWYLDQVTKHSAC